MGNGEVDRHHLLPGWGGAGLWTEDPSKVHGQIEPRWGPGDESPKSL